MDATEHFNTVELLLLVLKDSRLNVKTVAQGGKSSSVIYGASILDRVGLP